MHSGHILQELSQFPKILSPSKSAHFEQDELPGQTEGSALKKRKIIIIRLFYHCSPILMNENNYLKLGSFEFLATVPTTVQWKDLETIDPLCRRAPLIDLKKNFFNKVFYRLKLFRKFQFYTWMTKSGRKSVKKSQKLMKKATNLVYNAFFIFIFVLANLKHINGYNMMKKNLVSLLNFRT